MDTREAIKHLRGILESSGGHLLQLTPRRADDTATFTLLLIENPSQEELDDLAALQQKWDSEE